MNKVVASIIIASVTVLSCQNNDSGTLCYHGKVIMSSCCTGSTFISIKGPFRIGKDTNLNGQEYSNVIQVPDYLANGDVYLNLRKFDPDKDASLFPIHCYCLIAVGMDVPVYVATAVSTTSCPDTGSH